MEGYNWHHWGMHTLWWIFWIAVVAGLLLIYRYAIKSIKKNDKKKDDQ